MNARDMTAKYTLLKKRSSYHPTKRGAEIERFGNPGFQAQLSILLEIVSQEFQVSVFPDDSLAVAIVRGVAICQAENSDAGEWVMSAAEWVEWTGLKRHRLDVAKKMLMDTGELLVSVKGFPPKSYCQCFYLAEKRHSLSTFSYHVGLSYFLGYEAAALFSWMAQLDKELEAQGYFFHLRMEDIQQSLGLSRYQVDRARKKLIEHDLLKERFWGIPAVREFRLKLDGLEQLISQEQ